jgi:lactoylglutathione lyase
MPHLEHVAMWVRDLDRVCSFYAEHFGATVGERYENPAKGFASRFLWFASGARLEVMTTTALVAQAPGAERMGLAHLAIAVGTAAEVDAMTARLGALGVTVLASPRRTGDGYYESVVLDPEGNRLELVAFVQERGRGGPDLDPLDAKRGAT